MCDPNTVLPRNFHSISAFMIMADTIFDVVLAINKATRVKMK